MSHLENWVRGCSKSLKMAPFDRPYMTFYWSATVNIALYLLLFLSYLTLNNIVTLKSGLEVTQDHSKWHLWLECESLLVFHWNNVCMSPIVSEIVSVKEWRDLENWVRGCSKSLKMAPFNRPYTTFYWSAIVNIALSWTVFLSYLTLNTIVTLKSGLEVTQVHSNWYHSKSWVRFPIRLPW